MRVDDGGNQAVVHAGLVPGDTLGHHYAFLGSLVGQHRAAHQIADGPDTVHTGGAVVVHLDEAAFVLLHTAVIGKQAFGAGLAAHADDDLVEDFLVLAVL